MKVMSSENDFAQHSKISERFTSKYMTSRIRKIKSPHGIGLGAEHLPTKDKKQADFS